MNYKESAAQLNEFNDFMALTKTKLLCQVLANAIATVHFNEMISMISRMRSPMPKNTGQHFGCGSKNISESTILPKGEFIIPITKNKTQL